MKIVVRVLLFAALVTIGIWLWTVLFPSPEKLIRKRLAEVARLASVSAGEGLVTQGLRIQGLINCFDPQAELTFDLPGHPQYTIAGRDEITEHAGAARRAGRALNVELLDPNVVLSADKQSAVVALTARVRMPDERDFIVQEMKFTLKKINGEWLIIRVETVRTLSQATGADGLHPRMFALNHNGRATANSERLGDSKWRTLCWAMGVSRARLRRRSEGERSRRRRAGRRDWFPLRLGASFAHD